jgi:hypothetical protein
LQKQLKEYHKQAESVLEQLEEQSAISADEFRLWSRRLRELKKQMQIASSETIEMLPTPVPTTQPNVRPSSANSTSIQGSSPSFHSPSSPFSSSSSSSSSSEPQGSSQEIKPREILLSSPPFLSTNELIIHYNEYFDKSAEEKQQPEIQKKLCILEDTIQKVIGCISRGQDYTIRQGMGLVSCHNSKLVKALIEKLLEEIGDSQLNFPMLYHALGHCIEQQIIEPTLGADDKTQTAMHITEKLEQVHAADLNLSCIMLYSLYQTLALMLHNNSVGQLAKKQHKDRIQQAIENFEIRLEAVEVQDDESGKRAALANIREALTFAKHALQHISDHRSIATQRIDQIKIAASLLLQATETSAVIGSAVATGGVTSISAASSSYALLSRIYHIGNRVRKDYQADKAYLTALTNWQEQWWSIVEQEAGTPKRQEQLLLQQLQALQAPPEMCEELKSDKKTQKAYQHPLFIRAIANYLRVLYSEPTTTERIRGEIMNVLRNYYILAKKEVAEEAQSLSKKEKGKRGKEKQKESSLKLKGAKKDTIENARHIANILLMMAKKADEITPVDISFIDEQHSKIFKAMQPDLEIQSETSINLVTKIWEENYPSDVDLYRGLTDENLGPKARFAVIAALQSTKKPERKLSFWGEALLAIYPKAKIQATAEKIGSKYIADSLKIAGNLIVADKGREFAFKVSDLTVEPCSFWATEIRADKKHAQDTSDKTQVTAETEKDAENALEPWYADFAQNIEVDGDAKRFRDYCRIDYEYGEKKTPKKSEQPHI